MDKDLCLIWGCNRIMLM